MERGMGAAAEQDRMAGRGQERREESETGEREPGGRPWYEMGAGEGKQRERRGGELSDSERRGAPSVVLTR